MVKVFNDLIKEVTTPGYCLACGACVASCLYECLAMEGETPALKKTCMNCGICYEECPQVIDQKELERLELLGKTLPIWLQAQPPTPKEEELSRSIAQP